MLRVSAKGMLVVVIMALAFMITPVRAEGFAGGSGTAEDPYLIETAEQFNTIRYNLTAHYKLTTDIDLSGYENWEPIGTANAPFVGALDGTGYTIGGLSIDRAINDVGLFGSIAGNSCLENIKLSIGAGGIKGRDRVGGLAGSASCTNGIIRNCTVAGPGTVSGFFDIGGLIGQASFMTGGDNIIQNCKSEVDISALYDKVGGLVGRFEHGRIERSYAAGKIEGRMYIGGLVGYSYARNVQESSVTDSFAIGTVQAKGMSGKYHAGGLVGYGYGISQSVFHIKNCYAAVDLSGTADTKGIIVGEWNSFFKITDTYADGVAGKCVARTEEETHMNKLTTEMKRQATYANWDFSAIWAIEENKSYPYLRSLDKPLQVDMGPVDDVAGGSGTAADPYLIETAEQLHNIRYNLTAHYRLAADIDLSGYENWEPIGTADAPFIGALDGAVHTIGSLSIDRSINDVGLFGSIAGNSRLENIKLFIGAGGIKGRDRVGGLAGSASCTNGLIRNCTVAGPGTVSGFLDIGGLIGQASFMTGGDNIIQNCKSEVDISALYDKAGGLVGRFEHGRIERSYAAGKIEGRMYIGGLVGYSYMLDGQESSITDSFAIGEVKAKGASRNYYAGGLVGYIYGRSQNVFHIKNCYAAVDLSGTADTKGIIIGEWNSFVKITDTYADGVAGKCVARDGEETHMNKLTTEMKRQATYANWDFSAIWAIEENKSYPYLRSLDKPLQVDMGPVDDVAGGSGTAADPYLIETAEQLHNIRYNLTAHYRLAADIDLSGYASWEPIGTADAPFIGALDGAGHTIGNLSIDRSINDVGLFGSIAGNSRLENIKLHIGAGGIKGRDRVGGLAGSASCTNGLIRNCTVAGAGTVSGFFDIGGLIGQASFMTGGDNTIQNCKSEVDISALYDKAGGLVGRFEHGRIDRSYAAGKIEGRMYIGGLVGYSYMLDGQESSITDSFAIGTVQAKGASRNYYAGGLVGYIYGRSQNVFHIQNCYAAVDLSGTADTKGIIIGEWNSFVKITDTYADGVAGKCVARTEEETHMNKLTTAMKRQATYANWDFSAIWAIEENKSYPYLRSLDKPLQVDMGPVDDVAGGSGTAADPYLIETAEQLHNIRYNLTAHYRLAADIDLSGYASWEPIGTADAPFIGALDGAVHTIGNLSIDRTINDVGLFGSIAGSSRLENIKLSIGAGGIKGRDRVGGLAGSASCTNGIIRNCTVAGPGTVSGFFDIGGLIGQASFMTGGDNIIQNCKSEVDISALYDKAGGLVGQFEHGRIDRSYAAGKIEGRMYIGGLVGYSYMLDGQESSITDSFAIGEIKARGASRNYYAGGLVGYIYGISQSVFHIQNCYAAVDLSGTAADKGGLVARGNRVLEVTSSFYDGTVNPDVSSDLYNIPKTSEELKTIATFEGWDIAEGVDNMKIWSIRSGQCYPWLNKIGQPDSEDFPEVVLATGVVLHKDVITLTIGLDETIASETLIAVVQPPDAYNKAVTWHSNHPEIAAVDQTGIVTGLSEGTAIITVTTKDGDHADTCRVVVRRAEVPAEVPDNIRLKAASTSIIIQWDEVDGATGYEVRADDVLQSVTEAVYIHEGLKPNTTYRYQVRAVNAYGAGEWSRIVEKSTLSQGAPAIPTNIRGTSTDTSITIQWDPAADATGYELETDSVLRSVTDTVYRHTGLEPATWHRYRVRAVNDKGKSEWSDVFRKSTLFQGIPETPANIRAAVTSTGILLEWDEVLGASGYVVEADGAPQSVAEAVYHHTGLEPGTWHRYRIKAVNAYGAGEWSQVFKQATLSTEELNAPAGIEAAATRTSITLTWEDVPGASGYEVEVYGTVIDNGTSTQYTHEGLNANTQYAYRIRAKNAKGVGPWSGIVAKTTLTGIPANISTEADDASITVSWDNVSGAAAYDVEIDGGQIVECIAPFYIHRVVNSNMRHTYRVRSKNAEGISDWSQPVSNITLLPAPQNVKGIVEDTNIVLSWEEVEQAAGYDVEVDGTIIDNGAGTSYIHKGLAANSTHIYRVRAKNADTLGMWSEEIIKVVRPVSDISLTAEATDTEIRVMWNTVNGATGYDIEVDGKIIDNGLSTIYVHQGLEPNTAHTYRVRARNAGGAGEWSELITQITSAGKPGNVLVTATSTSIRLVWEEVYGAVGYDILAGSEIIDHGMNTAYEHTGLEPNTLHIYRIRVRTEAGEGMWSEPITQFTMVGAPSNIFVEAQSTQIALKWDAVDGATGYEIEADGVVLELGTATAYVHEGLTPNTLHTYRVRAKNENGIGDWSELIRQIAAPSIHLNLRATAATDSITVMWDAVEGAVAYDIEADGHIVEDIKETSYVHQGLTPNTRHMYRVRVKNEGATSEWSERLEHNTMPELNIDVGKDNEFNFVVVVPEKEGTTTRRIVVYYNPEQLEVVDLCAITPEIEDQAGAIEGTDMRIDSFVPGEIAYVVQNADKVVVNSIKFRVKTNGHSKVRYVIE